jgi:hypothetical protein
MQFFSPIFIKVLTRQLDHMEEMVNVMLVVYYKHLHVHFLFGVGIFHYFLWWVGWQEPGKLYKKFDLFSHLQSTFWIYIGIFILFNLVRLLQLAWLLMKILLVLSSGESCRAASFFSFMWSFQMVHRVFLTKPNCVQSSSTLHHCCCHGREEPSLADIWEDGRNRCLKSVSRTLFKQVKCPTSNATLISCRLNCQVECYSCCLA